MALVRGDGTPRRGFGVRTPVRVGAKVDLAKPEAAVNFATVSISSKLKICEACLNKSFVV